MEATWGARIADGLGKALDVLVVTFVALVVALCGYALWDVQLVEGQASSARWTPYRPAEDGGAAFADLRAQNPDVRSWLTVFGTEIDYPVCQSQGFFYYLSHDAQGEPSAAGSLFLSPSEQADLDGTVSVIYGHNMANDAMFGQLRDYANAAFLEGHAKANIHTAAGSRGVELVGYLVADAYDTDVFLQEDPAVGADLAAYVDLLRSRASVWRQDVDLTGASLVLLATCSGGSANARSVVVGGRAQRSLPGPLGTAGGGYGLGCACPWLDTSACGGRGRCRRHSRRGSVRAPAGDEVMMHGG